MPQLIVDTDGASDDAAALLIAAQRPELLAVTVCGGVVDVDRAVHNVLVTLAIAGRPDVPVYRGAFCSLAGAAFPAAEDIHGAGGLGGHQYPPPARGAEDETAADVLTAVLNRRPADEPATILTLGPLTNLAEALSRSSPDVAAPVRLVSMAGAQDGVGNVTAVAEYNVFCDPEAAAAVIGSSLDITLVGWDVSRRDAVIGDVELDRIRHRATPRSEFFIAATSELARFCRREQGLAGFDLPDAAAAAVAIDAGVVKSSDRVIVGVDTANGHTRGMTVLDRQVGDPAGRVTVVWAIDHIRFVDLLADALA